MRLECRAIAEVGKSEFRRTIEDQSKVLTNQRISDDLNGDCLCSLAELHRLFFQESEIFFTTRPPTENWGMIVCSNIVCHFHSQALFG